MEKDKVPYGDVEKIYNEILSYTHEEYNEMKDETNWENIDVSNMVGYKHMSVKNQTRPSNPLPIWAQMLVFVWRLKYKKYRYFPEGEEHEKLQAMITRYRNEFNSYMEENAKLVSENEELGVKLRKEERKNKKLGDLIEKLEGIEKESIAEIPGTATEMKRELNSLGSKHRRKMIILGDMKSLFPDEPIEEPIVEPKKVVTPKKITAPKGTPKATTKGSTKGVTPKKRGTPRKRVTPKVTSKK